MFLPKAERIAYLSFDVARCHKTRNVLSKLEEIGLRCVVRHGWFQVLFKALKIFPFLSILYNVESSKLSLSFFLYMYIDR